LRPMNAARPRRTIAIGEARPEAEPGALTLATLVVAGAVEEAFVEIAEVEVTGSLLMAEVVEFETTAVLLVWAADVVAVEVAETVEEVLLETAKYWNCLL